MIQIAPLCDLTMVLLCSPTNLKLHYFLPTFGCCSLIGSLFSDWLIAEFSVNELGSWGHEDTGFLLHNYWYLEDFAAISGFTNLYVEVHSIVYNWDL